VVVPQVGPRIRFSTTNTGAPVRKAAENLGGDEPKAKREEIIALANAGMSRQGIIEELHVSQRTLYRYFPPQSPVYLYKDPQVELEVKKYRTK
jgi:hypothetical protein